ncbi:hypothetical protein ACFO6W_00455, partial [Dysgonomonas termitidis]
MLKITTDTNSIKAERNGNTLFVAAKNTVSYSKDNTMVFLNAPDIVRISEAFSGGITMNGTPITAENIEAEFADLFESQGGGGQGIWGQITGTLSDQQDLNDALAGIQEDIDGLAVMQGNWLGQDFATYAALTAYDAGLTEKPANKTWTFVHADENPAGGNGAQACYAWLIPEGGTEPELSFRYKILVPTTETDPVFTAWKGDTSVRAGAGSSTAGPYS